jgi:hypothetical protein
MKVKALVKEFRPQEHVARAAVKQVGRAFQSTFWPWQVTGRSCFCGDLSACGAHVMKL